jgi:soluble lytic murein transglycosylase-like protein
MNKFIYLPLFLLLFSLLSVADGEVYYYRDEMGRIHISDHKIDSEYRKITPKKKRQIEISSERLPEPAPELYVVDNTKYARIIYREAKKNRVSPTLIRAVIKVESDFNPNCKSSAGAMGLMQLMPSTAREVGVEKPYDPAENIAGGVKYLRKMIEMFEGDINLALAAYNAGPGRVIRAGRKIPNIKETINYVKKVNYYFSKFSKTSPTAGRAGKYKQQAIRYYRLGKTKKAISYFWMAAKKAPSDATNYYNLGFIYSREGYYKKAIKMYRRALAINPYMKSAYYNLAITFERRGEYDRAISVWREYIDHESDHDKIESAKSYIRDLESFKGKF